MSRRTRVADIWRGRIFYRVERSEQTPGEGMTMDHGVVYCFTLWGARRRARRWARIPYCAKYIETWS